jgi:hypothetical protein
MENAVIYEITVEVESELREKYEDYMRRQHIPDLLATGYFRAADFSRSSPRRYRVRYEAFDQNALDKYLEAEAARLRADFIKHFPAGVQVSREIWTVVQFWNKAQSD